MYSARMRIATLLLLAACGGGTAPPKEEATFFPNVHTIALDLSDRTVTLYVPGFAYDKTKAFWLVLNDGQDVGQLGLAGTLSDLWSKSQIAPAIVIAAPAVDRLQQYGTVEHDAAIACLTDGQQLGTKAADYEKFVLSELLPAAQRALGFRPPASRTGMAGASLGALAAFSIAWDHPEAFSFAGAMSGSFWWRTDESSVQARNDSRIQQNIVGRSALRPGFRAWFEAGTADETADRDNNGVIDAIDDTLALIARMDAIGQTDHAYVEIPGGTHSYATWSYAFPQFLTWAAPP